MRHSYTGYKFSPVEIRLKHLTMESEKKYKLMLLLTSRMDS